MRDITYCTATECPSKECRNEACQNCGYRKSYAKAFDVHFDWLDCPYDCENDYEHLEEELKNLGKKKE